MFELGDQGEPSSNKTTDVDANKTSNTFFPTVKAVFDWVSGLFVKGAVASTDNAIARFDGSTGKVLQNSSVAITDAGFIGVGCVPDRAMVVNGEIGLSYNITTSFHGLKRDGLKTVYFANATSGAATVIHEFMGNGSSPKLSITQGGYVGINGVPAPTATLDINGTSRFRSGATFNANIIDNVGSSGADGQVLKKVGGLVLWSNP